MSEPEPIDSSTHAPPHLVQAGMAVRVVIALCMLLIAFLPWSVHVNGAAITGVEWHGAGLLVLCGGMVLAGLVPLLSRRPQVGLASAIASVFFALGALWLATGLARHAGETVMPTRAPHAFRDLAWVTFAVGAWQAYVHGVAVSRARKSGRPAS